MKHVLLVGATDGIGRSMARVYLRRGWRVAIVGRSPEKTRDVARGLREEVPDGVVLGVPCDVADVQSIQPAFAAAVRALGQMDLFVYCAGIMPPYGEGVEERVAGIGPVLDVNVRGAMTFLELAADYFVTAGRGHLAAIGSVAGERARKGHPVYGASKAALHQYLEGLRARLHPSGVRVTAIKPGWVRTKLLLGGGAKAGAHGSRLTADPDRAAEAIVRGLQRGREVIFVPWWWGWVGRVLRVMPRWAFKRWAPP